MGPIQQIVCTKMFAKYTNMFDESRCRYKTRKWFCKILAERYTFAILSTQKFVCMSVICHCTTFHIPNCIN